MTSRDGAWDIPLPGNLVAEAMDWCNSNVHGITEVFGIGKHNNFSIGTFDRMWTYNIESKLLERYLQMDNVLCSFRFDSLNDATLFKYRFC
jgi:hypothetical protein